MLDRCLSFLPSNSTTVIDGPSPPRIFNKQRGAHLIDRALQPLVGLLRELLYSLTVGEWSSVYTVYIFPPIQLKKDMSLQFVPSINFRNYIKKKNTFIETYHSKNRWVLQYYPWSAMHLKWPRSQHLQSALVISSDCSFGCSSLHLNHNHIHDMTWMDTI